MRRWLLRLAPALHLTRVTMAFAAVGDVWFVILWTGAHTEEKVHSAWRPGATLPALLLGGAVTAVGLFAFAQALNDTLDVRRDRVLHPLRPLASGRLNLNAGVALVALSLMVAALGAVSLGQRAVVMCLLTAGAVVFYHAAAKFVPAVGLVALSLIYAAHMLIPNASLVFVWPVWLVMTHSMLVGAVTHRLARRRPTLGMSAIVAATLGWAFWTAALLGVGYSRAGGLWPGFVKPWAPVAPLLLVGAFCWYAWRKAQTAVSPARAADKITRYGALWLTLYGVAWLAGQGHATHAAILGALALAGFVGMTVLREVYALIEQPVAYRR